jgi:hypothetical protein
MWRGAMNPFPGVVASFSALLFRTVGFGILAKIAIIAVSQRFSDWTERRSDVP